jgi:hypothetical protein
MKICSAQRIVEETTMQSAAGEEKLDIKRA